VADCKDVKRIRARWHEAFRLLHPIMTCQTSDLARTDAQSLGGEDLSQLARDHRLDHLQTVELAHAHRHRAVLVHGRSRHAGLGSICLPAQLRRGGHFYLAKPGHFYLASIMWSGLKNYYAKFAATQQTPAYIDIETIDPIAAAFGQSLKEALLVRWITRCESL